MECIFVGDHVTCFSFSLSFPVFSKTFKFPWVFTEILTIFQIPWVFQVFHVLQVCGHPEGEELEALAPWLASTEIRSKLENQIASLASPYCHQLTSRPEFRHLVNTCTALHCTAMFVHTSAVEQIRSYTCYQPQCDNVYTTSVSYDMNTKKRRICHTQHWEGAFNPKQAGRWGQILPPPPPSWFFLNNF